MTPCRPAFCLLCPACAERRSKSEMTNDIGTDVFVIGGGPAGLVTAIAARKEGFRASVADCGAPPLDKACGEGLMPHGVAALRELGVAIDSDDGVPFRGIQFIDHELAAQADFPRDWGLGLRRTRLHKLLCERAYQVGVEMHWGTRVQLGEDQRVYVNGVEVRSRWIVGADGQNSRVRKWAGLRARFEGAPRYGFRRHYRVAPWSEQVEVHWNSRSEIYVTPTGARDVCVAVLTRDPRLRIDEALRGFPAISKRLAGAETSSKERGAACVSRSLEDVSRGKVLLVGDASCTVDPITGDGLSLAMQQAVSMARALAKDDVAAYKREHRRSVRLPMLMSRTMLMLAERRWMRRRAIRRLAAHPGLFAKLLSIHVGGMELPDIGAAGVPEFIQKFIFAHRANEERSYTALGGTEVEPR